MAVVNPRIYYFHCNNIFGTFYPCRSAAKAEFKLRGYAPQVRRMDIGVI